MHTCTQAWGGYKADYSWWKISNKQTNKQTQRYFRQSGVGDCKGFENFDSKLSLSIVQINWHIHLSYTLPNVWPLSWRDCIYYIVPKSTSVCLLLPLQGELYLPICSDGSVVQIMLVRKYIWMVKALLLFINRHIKISCLSADLSFWSRVWFYTLCGNHLLGVMDDLFFSPFTRC